MPSELLPSSAIKFLKLLFLPPIRLRGVYLSIKVLNSTQKTRRLCVIAAGIARVHPTVMRWAYGLIEIRRKVGNTALANIYRKIMSVCLYEHSDESAVLMKMIPDVIT